MYTDPIADLLTRVRNAQAAGHPTVQMPASKAVNRVLAVLEQEGYISRVVPVDEDTTKPQLKVFLRYQDDGNPVIHEAKRISRSGRRVYVGADDIPVYRSGLGTVIVSTSQGVITGRRAKELNIGGELLCSLF